VNGQSVVRTEKHPVGINIYEDVDKGASFNGPIAPCYFGPPQDLSLIVTIMEQDEGDPNAFKNKIDAAAKAAAAAAASAGASIPDIAVTLLGDLANALVGSGDDLIAQVSHSFKMSEVLEEARKPRMRDRDVEFTFFTDHRGEGATYKAYFDVEEAIKTQPGWRSCPKCQGMHFAGFPDFKGVCPAGGQHEQTNSFAYVMMHDLDPMNHVQVDWRSCRKCQGLFFGPFKGHCPAGGEHDAAGSFNYGLRFD
jgi:hypothetical protein